MQLKELQKRSILQRFMSFLLPSTKKFEERLVAELKSNKSGNFEESLENTLDKSSAYFMPNKTKAEEIIGKCRDGFAIKMLLDLASKQPTDEISLFEGQATENTLKIITRSPEKLKSLNLKALGADEYHIESLVNFATEFKGFDKKQNKLKATIKKLQDGLEKIKKGEETTEESQISALDYIELVKFTGNSIDCYGTDIIKFNTFLRIFDNAEFNSFKELHSTAQKLVSDVNEQFQQNIKGKFKSGDILETIVEKEIKVRPNLAEGGFAAKIYFLFKNLITKHGHSALLVHDKKDDKIHLSHITDKYRHNELEFHHLIFSDVYHLDFKNKKTQKLYENTQTGLYDAFHEHIVSSNDTGKKIMSGLYKLLHQTTLGFLKLFRPLKPIDQAIDRAYLSKTDEESRENLMFCSEFVAESINASITQINAHNELIKPSEKSKRTKKRSAIADREEGIKSPIVKSNKTPATEIAPAFAHDNARALPPQEMIEKLQKAKSADIVDVTSTLPLFKIIKPLAQDALDTQVRSL